MNSMNLADITFPKNMSDEEKIIFAHENNFTVREIKSFSILEIQRYAEL